MSALSLLPSPLSPPLSVFNKYRKRHIHNTVNLLTGEADVAPGSIKVRHVATPVRPVLERVGAL